MIFNRATIQYVNRYDLFSVSEILIEKKSKKKTKIKSNRESNIPSLFSTMNEYAYLDLVHKIHKIPSIRPP